MKIKMQKKCKNVKIRMEITMKTNNEYKMEITSKEKPENKQKNIVNIIKIKKIKKCKGTFK
jgi:hypothetical protein